MSNNINSQTVTSSASPTQDLSHHTRFQYCTKRSQYREGRKLTAVKVYTLADESRHLLIFGVPKINLSHEVKRLFEKIGGISSIRLVTAQMFANKTVELEQFTDCYHIVYEKIYSARRAKRIYDRRSFYGGILHISYAPEYETIEEIGEKIALRKREIQSRASNRKYQGENEKKEKFALKRHRKPSE